MATYLIPTIGDAFRIPVNVSCVLTYPSQITQYSRESKAAATDFILVQPIGATLTGAVGPDDLENGIEARLGRMRGQVVTLVHKLKILYQAAIASMELAQSADDGNGAQLSVSLQQIPVAQAVTIRQTPTFGDGKAGGSKNQGRVQKKTPTTEEDSAYNSILGNLISTLTGD